MTIGIYAIVNTATGQRYIGQSTGIETRWRKHVYDLRRGNHHGEYLQRSWKKYGEHVFCIEILEVCQPDKKILCDREQYYIDLYRAAVRRFGFNTAPVAGSILGVKRSDETKKKMSTSMIKAHKRSGKQRVTAATTREQWTRPDVRQKMLVAIKEANSDPGVKLKRGAASRARWSQVDVRQKMIEGHRGENSGNAKLTESKVRDIKRKLVAGVSSSKIAAQYGVAPRTIRDINIGATWKYVT